MNKFSARWVGLLLGAMVSGVWGAIFGFLLGILYEKRWIFHFVNQVLGAQTQVFEHAETYARDHRTAFTSCIVVLGAKMAKADGRVTREEINAFRRVFQVPDNKLEEIGALFNQASSSAEGYEPYAAQLATLLNRDPFLLEEVLTGLFAVAVSDGQNLSSIETNFLRRVAALFGFSEYDFIRIAARSGVYLANKPKPKPQENNYTILGVSPQSSDAEVKKAYRALIREHHPDKLTAQGLPPELIKQATEKMKRLNAAYDSICKQRGMK